MDLFPDVRDSVSFGWKSVLIFGLLLSISSPATAVGDQEDSTLVIFPDNRLFSVLFLDPLECQVAGSSNFLSQKEKDLTLYSTVNLGFNKPLFAKQAKYFSWELNFAAAAFIQFDLLKNEDGSYLAGLMNTDFKVSADYTIKRNDNLLRLRVFHSSSHLGDDYIQRNSDSLTNDKSGNYEQVDLTYLRRFASSYFYTGIGAVYNKYAYRERLSFQAGGLLNFRNRRHSNLFTGFDLKLLAENNFEPDIKTAFGVSFNRNSKPLARIWAEYYSGQLPYSTIDYGRVNWYGLALMFNIFNCL